MKTRYTDGVGFAEMWRTGDMWVLHMLYVPPKQRGKGCGSKLLHQVLSDADSEGITIGLQVAGDGGAGDKFMTDEELMTWYAKLGFVHDDRFLNPGRLIRKPQTK